MRRPFVRRRVVLTPLTALTFLLAGSGRSEAHVTLEPKAVPVGEHVKLTLRVPHGCDGSATTALHVQIPAGLADVKPKVHPGWTISVKKTDQARPAKDGKGLDESQGVGEVSWSGGPLPDAFMDEFELAAKTSGKAGETLTLPVTQECEKGTAHYTPTLRLTSR